MSWYAAGSWAARAEIPGRAVGDAAGDADGVGVGGGSVCAIAAAGAEGVGVAVLVATGAPHAARTAAESRVSART